MGCRRYELQSGGWRKKGYIEPCKHCFYPKSIVKPLKESGEECRGMTQSGDSSEITLGAYVEIFLKANFTALSRFIAL